MKNSFDIQNLVSGKVLPPLPPFPKSEPESITTASYNGLKTVDGKAVDKVEHTIFGTPQTSPIRLKLQSDNENDYWLLPVEPLITVSGKNIIIKRNVAKSNNRGSIKERWAQDDYQITIEGLFTTIDSTDYPENDLKKFKRLCEAKEPIDVLSPLFEIFGINRIVIENYELPFTKGPENQSFSIKALSDDDWELLIKVDD